jgi:hypothetical protein
MIIPSPTVPPESSHFRQSGAWFNHFKLTKVQQGNTNLTISQNLKLAPADQAAEDRELAASGITANVTGYSGLLFAPTNPRFLERNNPKRCECRGEREKLNCQRQLKFLFTERLARGIKRVLCHI